VEASAALFLDKRRAARDSNQYCCRRARCAPSRNGRCPRPSAPIRRMMARARSASEPAARAAPVRSKTRNIRSRPVGWAPRPEVRAGAWPLRRSAGGCLAAAASRAFREAVGQPHLVREVRSQGVGKIGAVGTKIDFSVFVEAEMVEQEIARGVAHHLVQRRPRRLRFERIVEQLLDPGGEQVLACAIPGVAQGPGASRRGARPARFVRAHLDLARDRAASCCRLLRHERRMPGARRGRLDLGEPEIRRAAMALPRGNVRG
jgi:hypothetical protein